MFSGEVEQMLLKENVLLRDLEEESLDSIFGDGQESLVNHAGGGSGGYLEHVFKYTAKELHNVNIENVTYKTMRSGAILLIK